MFSLFFNSTAPQKPFYQINSLIYFAQNLLLKHSKNFSTLILQTEELLKILLINS